jgi:putative Mg2+ transporter-C (MgtC) family protein
MVYELLLRLAIATVLGSLVGLERERAESAAGLRTHALVALGAALFMLVSMFGFANAGGPPAVVLDPSRVAAQVVTGIGFLGAGVIIFRKEIIRGLTTAASVWLVAAIGLAVGGGLYAAALGGTILALAILAIMKPLEVRLFKGRRRNVIRLVVDRRLVSVTEINEAIRRNGIATEQLEIRYARDPVKTRIDVIARGLSEAQLARMSAALADREGVLEVRAVIHAASDTTSEEVPAGES